MKKSIYIIGCIILVLIPALAMAHHGHDHGVTGTLHYLTPSHIIPWLAIVLIAFLSLRYIASYKKS